MAFYSNLKQDDAIVVPPAKKAYRGPMFIRNRDDIFEDIFRRNSSVSEKS